MLLVAVGLVLAYALELFQAYERRRRPVLDNALAARRLPKFSSDVRFDPFPRSVAPLETAKLHSCNVTSLHPCALDDVRTLFGCKELSVRCHHFDVDTPYAHNGTTTIIPRNATPNEGYALAIPVITSACNLNHGALTLIALNADRSAVTKPGVATLPAASEYMLVCVCTHPGYFGNEHLLGNCATPFVCAGKVESVDVPLDKVRCKCKPHETTIRYGDGSPACKEMLVHEANELHPDGWDHLVPWLSPRRIDTSVYSATIAGNLRVRRILNPCTNSLTNPTVEVPLARYDETRGECILTGYGYPVVGLNMLKPSEKRPALSQYEPPVVPIVAVLGTGPYMGLRISGDVAGVRRFGALMVRSLWFGPLDQDSFRHNKTLLELPRGLSVSGGRSPTGSLRIVPDHRFHAPKCITYASFRYRCDIRDYPIIRELGLPMTSPTPPPSFPWGLEEWIQAEELATKSFLIGVYGARVSAYKLSALHKLAGYGMLWTQGDKDVPTAGVVSFIDEADFEIHKRGLSTPA